MNLNIALSLIVTTVMTIACPSVDAQENHASRWPKQNGAFSAKSSEAIPSFPARLSGFRSEPGKDFWDKPFRTKSTLRVFQGSGWSQIRDFPKSMNACGAGRFMLRWRSSNLDVLVEAATGYFGDVRVINSQVMSASYGYMQGTNCEEPLFRFGKTLNGNQSTLVDIYYELMFWQAAP
jgi:hypothetical protein